MLWFQFSLLAPCLLLRHEVADFSSREPAGRLAVAASWMRICSAGEGLYPISDAKPISRNTKTPHAAEIAFPVDGRIFERQMRLLHLKMYWLNCCSGVCVNKQIDSANCGWCGNTCKYNLPCRNGLCGYGE